MNTKNSHIFGWKNALCQCSMGGPMAVSLSSPSDLEEIPVDEDAALDAPESCGVEYRAKQQRCRVCHRWIASGAWALEQHKAHCNNKTQRLPCPYCGKKVADNANARWQHSKHCQQQRRGPRECLISGNNVDVQDRFRKTKWQHGFVRWTVCIKHCVKPFPTHCRNSDMAWRNSPRYRSERQGNDRDRVEKDRSLEFWGFCCHMFVCIWQPLEIDPWFTDVGVWPWMFVPWKFRHMGFMLMCFRKACDRWASRYFTLIRQHAPPMTCTRSQSVRRQKRGG